MDRNTDHVQHDDYQIAFGSNIKAVDGAPDKRFTGYLVHFNEGDERDLDGERFIEDTNFMLNTHPLKGKPVMFHHGMDGSIGVVPIGYFDEVKKTSKGIAVEFVYKFADNYRAYMQELTPFDEWTQEQEAMLKRYDEYIEQRLRDGTYKFSSGALPAGVKTAKDGTILQWPMIEGSATPTPAEWRGRTQITSVKSLLPHLAHFKSVSQAIHEQEGIQDASMHTDIPNGVPDTTHSPSNEPKADSTGESSVFTKMQEANTMDEAMREEFVALIRQELANMGITKMEDEEVDEMAKAIEPAVEKAADIDEIREYFDSNFADVSAKMAQIIAHNDAQRKAAKREQFDASVAKAQQEAQLKTGQPASKAQPYDGDNNARISVSDRRYDHWTPADFALAATLAQKSRQAPNAQALPIRTDAAFWRGFADAVTKSSLPEHRTSANVVKAVNAIKSDELDYSTQAGYGDEWVPTVWSNEILERARQNNVVLPLIQNVNMPSNPFIMPVESSDPTVYYVGETTDEADLVLGGSGNPIPDSKVATTNVTLTASKLGTRTGISAELSEDGVPSSIPMFRRQAERTLADAIDRIILNGDSATSNNVNYDGGTPTATNPHMGFSTGLVKSALVGNGVSAGGSAPTLAKIRQARFTLQNGSINAINDLAIICDNQTYSKLLGLDEFVTLDKAGAQATAQTGQIGYIDGIRVFASAEMDLAATNGKVSSTGGNNLYGRLLIVDTRYWYLGYRRQVTQSLEFLSYYDSWQMTTTVRLALTPQNNDHTAMLYYIAV